MRINSCPRCLAPGALVEEVRRDRNGRVVNTYYYVVHTEGKKKRKCYLGPAQYIYVTKTHAKDGLVLKGMGDVYRLRDYLLRALDRFKRMVILGTEEERRRFEEYRWQTLLEALEKVVEGLVEAAGHDTAKCLQIYEALDRLQEALKQCLEGIPTRLSG